MKANKFLLDTNIIAYLHHKTSAFGSSIKKHLAGLGNDDIVCVSALTIYEISYGESLTVDPEIQKIFQRMKQTIRMNFLVLPIAENGAEIFARLKSDYGRRTGITKDAAKRHDIDFLLASTAIVHDAVLVSNDRLFEKLNELCPELMFENWTTA